MNESSLVQPQLLEADTLLGEAHATLFPGNLEYLVLETGTGTKKNRINRHLQFFWQKS